MGHLWLFHHCSCIQSQEAAVAIHRWGNCRKALPDHSCPAALRQLASEGCRSHGTHSPRSKPHIHIRARGRRILLHLFHFPNFKGRISWANDTQEPTGRGSEPSNPKRQGMYYRMPSLYLAYHPFSILQNHIEIMIYCYIFHFLWPCGLISYCNFSRLLAGQWNNLTWSLQSPEVHVQKQTD